ncbi:hypothetical protein AMJ51_02145 [Microgenomates bacterium DG_75]|nr:MAG: hypothetical protein AMJ51_02145 [Microgenomates bacterium DG_75]
MAEIGKMALVLVGWWILYGVFTILFCAFRPARMPEKIAYAIVFGIPIVLGIIVGPSLYYKGYGVILSLVYGGIFLSGVGIPYVLGFLASWGEYQGRIHGMS